MLRHAVCYNSAVSEQTEYAKCACESCGGHIEYPVELGGSTLDCPHCHFSTALPAAAAARSASPRSANPAIFKAAALLAAVAAIAYGAWVVNTTHTAATSVAVRPVEPPTATNIIASPPPKPQPPQWDGLESDSPVQLEKAGEGSLVYAVGVLRNTTDKQKFGVKVEVDLFDARGAKVGSATDYAATIDAGAKWHFHALVVGSGAAKAKIKDVTEN